MASLNSCTLIGNVGQDPEIRYLQSGDPVANFSLATSEKWTGRDGNKNERTEWHRIAVFGKTAQVVRDYVKKGSPLCVMGKIQYEKWTDKEGNARSTTTIRADRIVLLGNGGGRAGGGGAAGGERGGGAQGGGAPAGGEQPGGWFGGSDDFKASDDDVPF